MGPEPTQGKEIAPSNIPVYDHHGEFQEYRKDVTRLVDSIPTATKVAKIRCKKPVLLQLVASGTIVAYLEKTDV